MWSLRQTFILLPITSGRTRTTPKNSSVTANFSSLFYSCCCCTWWMAAYSLNQRRFQEQEDSLTGPFKLVWSKKLVNTWKNGYLWSLLEILFPSFVSWVSTAFLRRLYVLLTEELPVPRLNKPRQTQSTYNFCPVRRVRYGHFNIGSLLIFTV